MAGRHRVRGCCSRMRARSVMVNQRRFSLRTADLARPLLSLPTRSKDSPNVRSAHSFHNVSSFSTSHRIFPYFDCFWHSFY